MKLKDPSAGLFVLPDFDGNNPGEGGGQTYGAVYLHQNAFLNGIWLCFVQHSLQMFVHS